MKKLFIACLFLFAGTLLFSQDINYFADNSLRIYAYPDGSGIITGSLWLTRQTNNSSVMPVYFDCTSNGAMLTCRAMQLLDSDNSFVALGCSTTNPQFIDLFKQVDEKTFIAVFCNAQGEISQFQISKGAQYLPRFTNYTF